jgi:vancomycin permeability regulator SanA
MVVSVTGLLPQAWVYASTSDRVIEIEDAPAAPVAIVFGAGLRPDGEPTQWLSHRLDAGAELYRSGRVRALLVTGDNSGPSYNEPGAMREYLIDEGVPARRIVTDDAGFNTWDSCARARTVFGVTEALLVSQDFHIPRVVALCEAAGIDGWGVSVPEWRSLFSSFREIAAAGTAAWQVISTPPPTSTTPPSASLERAMSGS